MTRRRRATLPRRRARGASLFEFLVAGVVAAILGGVMLARLADYRAQAERAAQARTVALLRTALALRVAQLRAGGNEAGIAALTGQNPIHWMAQAPRNYGGELGAGHAAAHPGQWYYDPADQTVTYLLRSGGNFPQRIVYSAKYKVELLHLPKDNNQASPALRTVGASLVPVDG